MAEQHTLTALAAQEERLNDLQSALHYAKILVDGIHFERIERIEAHAATYFAGIALEALTEGHANEAVQFVMQERRALEATMAQKETTA
ncbi:hypothetical protein OS190_06005 [Sulfitobacter sp. F26204]|nr:hypothetical protein [Sulfitobacter sp. F26204]